MRRFWWLSGVLLASAAGADDPLVARARDAGIPLPDKAALAPLLERAAERRAVLLGECTHGTSEFYRWRAALSRALVEQHGFRFLVVEGDADAWYAVRPYLAGAEDGPATAAEALRAFRRWPTWLWANEETAALLDVLREFNRDRPAEEQVFVYGLDLYGAPTSIRDVLDAVGAHDESKAAALAADYRALRAYGSDWTGYARSVAGGGSPTDGADRALRRIRAWLETQPDLDPAERFRIEHLALGIRDAERHYRAMPQPGAASWNKRADHFFTVLDRLLDRYGPDAQGIVWAHNTHIGDARATAMAARGQRNIGQLARERLGGDAVLLVGMTAARGRAVAARQWGAARAEMRMPAPRPGSLEARLERAGPERLLLLFDDDPGWQPFREEIGHRAVGVVYRPALDYAQNYVPTVPAARYDALLFFRQTAPLRLLAP